MAAGRLEHEEATRVGCKMLGYCKRHALKPARVDSLGRVAVKEFQKNHHDSETIVLGA